MIIVHFPQDHFELGQCRVETVFLLVQVATEGLEPENVYPNTFFLPESGIQRGSICAGLGDPLSPDWTSIKGKS
jgi:hypothetical protein